MLEQSTKQEFNSPFLSAYQTTIEALETLGLTGREASVYVTILLKQQMKAGEIARDLKIHRLDAYNILKSLQEKDMVTATLSKPMVFKAVPIESVINLLNVKHAENIRKASDALDELDHSSKRLADFLDRIDRDDRETNDKLQVLSGRKTMNERWSRLLSSAESEILIAATEKDTAQFLVSSVADIIALKRQSGVKVNVYTPVTKSNADQFLSFREHVRHLRASSSAGLCVIDRKTVMMVLVYPGQNPIISKKDETAVLINSRSIGEILGTLFFVGWDTSPLIEEPISIGYQSPNSKFAK